MQLLRSMLELNLEKQDMSNSGGRRLTGEMRCSSSMEEDMVMSLSEATPREDWESFRWVVKKSVSS